MAMPGGQSTEGFFYGFAQGSGFYGDNCGGPGCFGPGGAGHDVYGGVPYGVQGYHVQTADFTWAQVTASAQSAVLDASEILRAEFQEELVKLKHEVCSKIAGVSSMAAKALNSNEAIKRTEREEVNDISHIVTNCERDVKDAQSELNNLRKLLRTLEKDIQSCKDGVATNLMRLDHQQDQLEELNKELRCQHDTRKEALSSKDLTNSSIAMNLETERQKQMVSAVNALTQLLQQLQVESKKTDDQTEATTAEISTMQETRDAKVESLAQDVDSLKYGIVKLQEVETMNDIGDIQAMGVQTPRPCGSRTCSGPNSPEVDTMSASNPSDTQLILSKMEGELSSTSVQVNNSRLERLEEWVEASEVEKDMALRVTQQHENLLRELQEKVNHIELWFSLRGGYLNNPAPENEASSEESGSSQSS